MGFEHMAQRARGKGRDAFPGWLDLVTLVDGTVWHVSRSNPETGQIRIWRQEFGGGGFHPTSSPGYSLREKIVTLKDIKHIY